MRLIDLHKVSDDALRAAIRTGFSGAGWVEPFMVCTHHGFNHGNLVRLGALKLIDQLTSAELDQLLSEGRAIDPKQPFESAVAITELAALLHDSGRIDDAGAQLPELQQSHHIIGAERIGAWFDRHDFPSGYARAAVLSHDYQSQSLTPHLRPPEHMIGKLVQASDQLGWFHPDSVRRTVAFGTQYRRPFLDPALSVEQRLAWQPSGPLISDSVTVLLHQLFGPSGPERFGVEAARKKVDSYKGELERAILAAAEQHGFHAETRGLIHEFRKKRP